VTPPPLAGIFGYRVSRWNVLGTQARLVVVDGHTLVVRDHRGRTEQRVDLEDATVRTRRGMVTVGGPGVQFHLYGLPGINRVPPGLAEQGDAVGATRTVLPVGAGPVPAFAASRFLVDALLAAGATRSDGRG